ncbi:membrane protein insertase YidC [Spirobacillus cienkowskii]|uniref:membrane protein insertase YidC n=1 Tax=Spirobacillus cienkowskii TaxID=495820 RepID=UPI0030D2A3FC
MKKETIGFMLGLFVLFGGYVAVQNYYIQQQMNATTTADQGVVGSSTQNLANNDAASGIPKQKPLELGASAAEQPPQPLKVANLDDLFIKSDRIDLAFTPTGGCISDNLMLGEKIAYNDSTPVSVIENHNICKAYGFRLRAKNVIDLRNQPAGIMKTTDGAIKIVQRSNGLEITRIFKFSPDRYDGDLQIIVKNISQQFQNTSVDFEIGATSDNRNHGSGMFSAVPPQYHSVAVRLPDGTVNRKTTPFEEKASYELLLSESSSFFSWMTADSLYWMNTVIPLTQTPIGFEALRTDYNLRKDLHSAIDQTMYEAWVKQPVNLSPGQATEFNYKIYIGPKNETILKNYDQYHLSETIDYGFLKIIARPMYHLMSFIHSIVANWGTAIIILTIMLNILFLPLNIKAFASGQKMQKLQPEMKAIQEKYKDDKQMASREMMALMAKGGANPLGGCLPLLPQIPVFFALDSCFRHTFELRQAPFYFWIKDLTQHDPYFLLPVLMAALMIASQKMMPMPSMDPTQAKMMKIIPIVFSVLMIFYPSGLALYIITNTLLSIIRQVFLTRYYKKA